MKWKDLLSRKRVSVFNGRPPSVRPVDDLRSEFEQDYGRAAFSTPVRRLQDKAQVFPLEEHDAVRTRLTHSLEVSSVARGLALRAEKIVRGTPEWDDEYHGVIPTIAATCGLIHDLGNPPFGHAGEEAIGSWFERQNDCFFSAFADSEPGTAARDTQFAQDFLKFEGNAQTQRLLSKLQVLADDNGLNMTCGTLSASAKYIARSNRTDKKSSGVEQRQPYKKHGYFASENSLITAIQQETGTLERRNPITFLVEAADDIVYATVDLEDAIKKKCVDWKYLQGHLKFQCKSDGLRDVLREAREKIRPAGFHGSAYNEAMAVAFRTFAIRHMVIETGRAFERNYDAIMTGDYTKELLYDSDAGPLAKACKAIALRDVYSSSQIFKREVMGRKIIHDLMDLYWEAAKRADGNVDPKGFPGKIYGLISPNYRQVFSKNMQIATLLGIPKEYFRMQLVTDQISGMTDSFAVTIHKELTNG